MNKIETIKRKIENRIKKMTITITNAFSISMIEIEKEGNINFRKITIAEVKNLLSHFPYSSAIEHADTAAVVSSILGVHLPANKIINVKLSKDKRLIVAQYNGPRLPEGSTTLPENASIDFWMVVPE
jgi:hypothetical protein